MPIYEYQCTHCQHAFEVIQKVNDDVVKKCEQCGKDSAVRLVSAPGFQLKGTGWYATDFKDKPKPKITSEHSDSEGKTSGEDKKSVDSPSAETKATTPAVETATKTSTKTTSKGEPA